MKWKNRVKRLEARRKEHDKAMAERDAPIGHHRPGSMKR